MPELPEVETVARGVRDVALRNTFASIQFLRKDLRFPIPQRSIRKLEGARVDSVERRSKYILINTQEGTLIVHLGMTGNLLELPDAKPSFSHTHAIFGFSYRNKLRYLHYVDPRRFGIIDYVKGNPEQHKLLANLGPEPLNPDLDLAAHLFAVSRNRKVPIKTFIMDAKQVVGVGNIYASEALFRAGISPTRPAGKCSKKSFDALSQAIIETLSKAIEEGGTSFRDFKAVKGTPGYFKVSLQVYDRAGEPCLKCGTEIESIRLGQRSTFFCPSCQKA